MQFGEIDDDLCLLVRIPPRERGAGRGYGVVHDTRAEGEGALLVVPSEVVRTCVVDTPSCPASVQSESGRATPRSHHSSRCRRYARTVVENLADIATHALADVLPWMSETELNELAEDIGARGQIEPVVMWIDETGKEWLLDGRHRAEAARRLGRPLSVRRF